MLELAVLMGQTVIGVHRQIGALHKGAYSCPTQLLFRNEPCTVDFNCAVSFIEVSHLFFPTFKLCVRDRPVRFAYSKNFTRPFVHLNKDSVISTFCLLVDLVFTPPLGAG